MTGQKVHREQKELFMKDDYLWDGSGEPDPEIQKLERVLGRYRHDRPAPSFENVVEVRPAKIRSRFLNFPLSFAFGVAAAILVVAVTLILFLRSRPVPNLGPAWDVARLEGAPRVGSKAIRGNAAVGKLGVGQTLETDDSSRAAITFDETGRVEVERSSRLRLVTNGPGHSRLSLERGTIRATIWAPPGGFVVDTPSAVAVDLGCGYTLHVDDSGAGLLRTTMGWVGFKLGGRESFIPAGAVCATRPKIGPGTPYFEDASESFRASLYKFDFEALTAEQRAAELGLILKESRARDALTIWHLLARVSDADRSRVYDRLVSLVPAPAGVTRDGILRLDQTMLDLWWNALDLGDVTLWRTWERSGFPSKISEK